MDYFAHIDGERKQSVLEHSGGSQDLLECLPENLESMNGDIAVVCCMILESTVSGSREDFKKEMFRWTIRRLEHNFVRRKEDTTRF